MNDSHNALIREKSPYLLQHAHNPVNWYPWGQDAFKKAKREDKPIFLSVGYATCHWCHVMAHESFEDTEVAQILNDHFVSIKVDREEQPDVDNIYMSVCQALTGQGGWPLSVFLTPDGHPFFAGTYFPKSPRMGLIGFPELLHKIRDLWRNDRSRILSAGDQITRHIQNFSLSRSSAQPLETETLRKAGNRLARTFDSRWGGFGSAPKFPSPHQFTFLLRLYKRTKEPHHLEMVEKTLQSMRQGGIFDQLGYGFHRYSVDERWFAPHFEKMLYDQALLAMAYTETYQVTNNPFYAQVAHEIFTYVLRDMTDPEGGFYSAEDADSDGREGLFYLWTPQEIREVADADAAELFCRFYDIQDKGNFEKGLNILHVQEPLPVLAERAGMEKETLQSLLHETGKKLFAHRKNRIHPLKDDKILTAWNGLMTAAFIKGYQVFGEKTYLETAQAALAFILNSLRLSDGSLLRRYREGEAAHPGCLDDYAFLTWALIEIYETTFDPAYLEEALALARLTLDLFWDPVNGGCAYTGEKNEFLITRTREAQDGAIPSGNSVTALNLLRLGRLTGDSGMEERADALIRSFSGQVAEYPTAFAHFLHAVDFMIGPTQEVVIAGAPEQQETRTMIQFLHRSFLPRKVLHLVSGADQRARLSAIAPFVENMTSSDGKATAYVCRRYACQAPITDPKEMETVVLETV
jgi:uncharacterized protein